MTYGQTVVLGWDALDFELAEAFGVASAFGPERTELDTITNPVLETPHTRELWPTLISGQPPAEHGIRVGQPGDSLDWSHPVVDRAAGVASHVLPHRVRAAVGRHLRNAGADLEDATPDDYATRGVDTVFDDRRSCALAIPNYWTPLSADLGLTSSRKATFRSFMRVGDSGGMEVRDDADLAGFEARLWASAGKKLAATRAAVARDYDIVWVWLGFLDTVGHVAPAVEQGGLQERAYRQAAAWTDDLRRALQPEDRLVCVSDHGLQGGDHTERAYLGATDAGLVDAVESVTDVRGALEAVTPRSATGGPTDLRPAYTCESGSRTRDVDGVEAQLENLGYL